MKILIKTNRKTGKVEVFDKDTGKKVPNVGRIDIYVNAYGKASAVITFQEVDLDIEVDTYENT